ncbi:MAG: PAS domain S-box protein [Candidatus Aminicenantes bacterium]|nr:PAS domain S-box protein [Candidatus Aminicenantes bacterium]
MKSALMIASPVQTSYNTRLTKSIGPNGFFFNFDPNLDIMDGQREFYVSKGKNMNNDGSEPNRLPAETKELRRRISRQKSASEKLKRDNTALRNELKKRQIFLKATPERVINVDLNGKILYINHTISEKIRDVIGASLYKFFPAGERKIFKDLLNAVTRSGKRKKYETTHNNKDGKTYIFENHFIPQKKNGKVKDIIVTARDVTERRKAELALQNAHDALEQKVAERTAALLETNKQMKIEIEERRRVQKVLKESEEMLRSILDSSPDAVTVTDMVAKIIDCNQTHVEMMGYTTKEELIGKSAFDLISKKQHKEAEANLRRTLKNGIVKNIDYTLVKKDGTLFPGEMSASIVHDASGKLAGFVAITKDITVRKKAEEALVKSEAELRAQKRALEEKNIALREIIAQIEIEKRKMQEDIIRNTALILSPILERIRANDSDSQLIDLLEYHLKNLASSFGRRITDITVNLSPREIEISNMIKAGMTSKDISKLLSISSQTVEKHRKNIRHKLGIVRRRVNLTAYLRKL